MNKRKKAEKKKAGASKKASPGKLRKEHPFLTDSQIENRYGSGREKSGSDGSYNDNSGDNH